jgi:hypothetical protein
MSPFLPRLKCSIKEEVKENTSPLAGIFPASQPPETSKICFDRPRRLLGWFGFPLLAIFIAVGNEACLFRNQQSRTALKWRP